MCVLKGGWEWEKKREREKQNDDHLSIVFKSSVPLNMANKMSLYLANSEDCLFLKYRRKSMEEFCVTPESLCLKRVLKIAI